MKTVNIHEAKTHLSRLLEELAGGEEFVIAKAGEPVAMVTAIKKPKRQRIGFLKGQISVPDDFDTMGQDEIAEIFDGEP
jgi:antitoxin (DNA-binding transcriptional repressor) of toxin-antitoxin stability system